MGKLYILCIKSLWCIYKYVYDKKIKMDPQLNGLLFSLQGLVVAGLADMTRPAEKLSTSQSAVLTATGKMWFNQVQHQLKVEIPPSPLSLDVFYVIILF